MRLTVAGTIEKSRIVRQSWHRRIWFWLRRKPCPPPVILIEKARIDEVSFVPDSPWVPR